MCADPVKKTPVQTTRDRGQTSNIWESIYWVTWARNEWIAAKLSLTTFMRLPFMRKTDDHGNGYQVHPAKTAFAPPPVHQPLLTATGFALGAASGVAGKIRRGSRPAAL